MPSHDERERTKRPARDPTSAGVGTLWIVSGPFSVRLLLFWGAVIFVAGFFHGRQMRNLSSGAAGQTIVPPPPAVVTAASSAPTAASPSNPTSPARVTIRLLKFSPDTIEVKAGEVVEWNNSDLTPHTATSSKESTELDSSSINAGASWRHTFTRPGTFSYFCTFHPEMKGVVLVK